jgi:hypothetical protein
VKAGAIKRFSRGGVTGSETPPSRSRRRGAARVCAPGAAALAALAVAALPGCGGSSGPPTKAQYIARANAICRAEQQSLVLLSQSSGSGLQAKLDEANRVRAQTTAKLAALKKPASDAVLSEWLRARVAALSFVRKITLKITEGKAETLGPAGKAANSGFIREMNRAAALARSYGLTDCKGFAAS